MGSAHDDAPSTARRTELIHDPVVILAAPRSGSSILFATLSAHPALWSLYRESNDIFEGPFDPIERGMESNRLTADDLDDATCDHLRRTFYDRVGNLELLPLVRRLPLRGRGRLRYARAISTATRPWKRPPVRIVEKSPKNSLRAPFIRKLFPDARFIHLTRDPRRNIASLYRSWQMPDRYKTYPLPPGFRVEGYEGARWSFMLQPGWRTLEGRSVMEICADQWRSCNEHLLRDLGDLPPERVLRLRYEDLTAEPGPTLGRVARWADLSPGPLERFADALPVVQAPTPPDPRKWEALREQIEAVLPDVEDIASELGYG